jgi:hypothetical protein
MTHGQRLFNLEDGSDTFLRNVDNHLQDYPASHLRRLQSTDDFLAKRFCCGQKADDIRKRVFSKDTVENVRKLVLDEALVFRRMF